MTETEEDRLTRWRMRQADPAYCRQWDTPPLRYEGEHGTVTLRSACGYPATMTVVAYGTQDYACDVHLAQAVRGLAELEGISVIDVIVREVK